MTLTQEETERYARHLSLPELGEQGQYKLKRAHVALTGLGGLGSPAALYLAAAGVGRLTLIDPDEVCLSNLQRQILHATDAAGTAKPARGALRRKMPFPCWKGATWFWTLQTITRHASPWRMPPVPCAFRWCTAP